MFDYYEWQVVEENGDFVHGSVEITSFMADHEAYRYLADNFRPGRHYIIQGRMKKKAPR